MGGSSELTGPDLENDGITEADLVEGGMLEGHAFGRPVLLARRSGELFAIGARCSHYGAPLADGLLSGDAVRCPWHHACFDLRTGSAVSAPALDGLACFDVTQRAGRIFVTGERSAVVPPERLLRAPRRVVVLGAGAAGANAVETLRREGFDGEITLVDRDPAGPVDRPNLSKDYLAGTAPEEWISLRSSEFYAEHRIELVLGVAVQAIDTSVRRVRLDDGRELAYDALLYALGAEPIRLAIPGADRDHVHLLRSLGDSRELIERARTARRAVVIGASFIGLEAAAALRARGLSVTVVAPESTPLARVLGDEVGAFIRKLHEDKGVHFHLQARPTSIGERSVTLDDGAELEADLVVMGVGVRPSVAIAQAAGIAVDGGVLTDSRLATSAPGVWAAGDVARYATASGERRRVEHWVHAGRQGQVAALGILGRAKAFEAPPFFWSVHYDVTLSYVGYANGWDAVQISGSLTARDAVIAYRRENRVVAIATIGRDRVSLQAEVAFESGDPTALDAVHFDP